MDSLSSSEKYETVQAKRFQWLQWVEAWYLAYALLGAVVAGMIPILLPLVVSRVGQAKDVGLVVAAFYLGGLSAPLWGRLADQYRWHRWLLVIGLLVGAISLTVFAFSSSVTAWAMLALITSIGTGAASTVANLFVVEAHPQAEWDQRIGWLQTFYGGGQVGGLILAGTLSLIQLRVGLFVAAGLTGTAMLIGGFTTRTPQTGLKQRPALWRPLRHGEWVFNSPQRLFHYFRIETLHKLRPALSSPFGLFQVTWLLAFSGSSAVFSLYPVLMQQLFGIVPAVSASAFAVAAGLGLALYSPAGKWSTSTSSLEVLGVAAGIRLTAIIILLALGLIGLGQSGWIALLPFTVIVLTWPLWIVSGTALTAHLATVDEGEAMGIFNATAGIAGVLGAILGGWTANYLGYRMVPAVAAVGVGLGLLVALCILPHHTNAQAVCLFWRKRND